MSNQTLSDRVWCCQCGKHVSEKESRSWGNGWVREKEFTGDLIQEGTCLECQEDNKRIGSMVNLGDLEVGDLFRFKHLGRDHNKNNKEIFVHCGGGFSPRDVHIMSNSSGASGDTPKDTMVEYRGKAGW